MRLTRISATDWMGYESLDLDLEGTDSAVIVGDNGSGKSSLLDAVTWALYDRVGRPDLSSFDALIRRGADECGVTITFIAGGHEVIVRREKARDRTGALTLTVDGENRTQHTIAETRAAIAALIGLPYEALMAGPFMVQETAGAFMRARPADRKALLVTLFGLDRFIPLHEEAKRRAAVALGAQTAAERAADDAALLAYDLPALRDELQAAEVRRDECQSASDEAVVRERACFADVANLEAEERNLALASHIWTQAEARRQSTLMNLDEAGRRTEAAKAVLAGLEAEDWYVWPEALVKVDPQEVEVAEARVAEVLEAEKARAAAETAVAQGRATVGRMMMARGIALDVPCRAEGQYAACRFLTDVPSEEALNEAKAAVALLDAALEEMGEPTGVVVEQQRLSLLQGQMREYVRHTERAASWEREHAGKVSSAKEILAAFQRQVDELNAAYLTAAQEAQQAWVEREKFAGVADDAPRARMALTVAQGTARAASEALGAAQRGVEAARVNVLSAERAEATMKTQEAAAAKAKAEGDTFRLLAAAFHRDGIPTRILESGIPLIEEEANEVLARLPGDMRLSLRTQRSLKTGAMADTLDVVLTVDGWESEYGLLSVGQRFRADLALRLGLARVLTHRTGATIETLWLDEPLAALDVTGREAVVETLATLAEDFGFIVVVSHHPDFNDRFGARIDVEQQDGISTARLVG